MNDSKPAQVAPKEAHDVAPRFAEYTDKLVYGEIWGRPGLSMRDKSMLTCAVLIAIQPGGIPTVSRATSTWTTGSPRES